MKTIATRATRGKNRHHLIAIEIEVESWHSTYATCCSCILKQNKKKHNVI